VDSEFITSRGKIILSKKRLLIQDLKVNFWKTAIGELNIPVLTLSFVVIFIFKKK